MPPITLKSTVSSACVILVLVLNVKDTPEVYCALKKASGDFLYESACVNVLLGVIVCRFLHLNALEIVPHSKKCTEILTSLADRLRTEGQVKVSR
jgi:hypothetical protein